LKDIDVDDRITFITLEYLYCLHPVVLKDVVLYIIRYLAQHYFNIIHKYNNYNNNNRWSLIHHVPS